MENGDALYARIAEFEDVDWYRQRSQPVSVDGEFCIGKDYPVEVKSAGDKGMGVFATKNIKRGDICCYYDGYFIHENGHYVSGDFAYTQEFYSLKGKAYHLAGFRTELRPGGCAQMCNDFSTTYTDLKDPTYLKNINVCGKQMGGKSLVFIATKRIKKGEELFYCYGPGYWQGKCQRVKDGNTDVKKMFDGWVEEHLQFRSSKVVKFCNDFKATYDTNGVSLEDYTKRLVIVTTILCVFDMHDEETEETDDRVLSRTRAQAQAWVLTQAQARARREEIIRFRNYWKRYY